MSMDSSKTDFRGGRHAETKAAALRAHGNVEAALGRSRMLGCNSAASRPLETVKMVAWKLNFETILGGAELPSSMNDEARAAVGLGGVAMSFWAVAAIDRRTRVVLGMMLTRDVETNTAMSCLQMISHDKGAICNADSVAGQWSQHGIPECIIVDNGAPFATSPFVAACHRLAVSVEFTIAGGCSSHDEIERALKAAIGESLSNISGQAAFVIVATALASRAPAHLRMALAHRIVGTYHDTPQTELGGKTPLKMWEEDHQKGNVPLRLLCPGHVDPHPDHAAIARLPESISRTEVPSSVTTQR